MFTTAQDFRLKAAGGRLSFTWLGVTRTFDGAVREDLIDYLGTDGDLVTFKKKIINTKNAYFKKLTSIKGKALRYWIDHTLPYLEKGVRLTTQDKFKGLREEMAKIREEIVQAAQELQDHRQEILDEAKEKLGFKLFNEAHYPVNFAGLFTFSIDPFNLEVPKYLQELDPEEYQRQQEALNKKIEQSLELFEEEMLAEGGHLIGSLIEQLQPSEDGSPKKFYSAHFDNLIEFFKKYKELRVRDNADLDQLIAQAQEITQGKTANSLKGSAFVRKQMKEAFTALATEFAGKIDTRPRRKILKKKEPTEAAGNNPSIGVMEKVA
jgi:hypothetical protein